MLRPADANETRLAWKIALESKDKPVVMALTRQNVRNLKETENLTGIEKGAYVISDCENPELIIIATGSEVELALDAKEILAKEGKKIRVVSMPSMELFRNQDKAYKDQVLPRNIKKVSLEMASTFGWAEWTGLDGLNIGIDSFGASGKGEEVMEAFGFTKEKVADKIREFLE